MIAYLCPKRATRLEVQKDRIKTRDTITDRAHLLSLWSWRVSARIVYTCILERCSLLTLIPCFVHAGAYTFWRCVWSVFVFLYAVHVVIYCMFATKPAQIQLLKCWKCADTIVCLPRLVALGGREMFHFHKRQSWSMETLAVLHPPVILLSRCTCRRRWRCLAYVVNCSQQWRVLYCLRCWLWSFQ